MNGNTNQSMQPAFSKNEKEIAIHPDGTKIYYPRHVSSVYATNVITDNFTDQSGTVRNRSEQNAVCARKWVDENQK